MRRKLALWAAVGASAAFLGFGFWYLLLGHAKPTYVSTTLSRPLDLAGFAKKRVRRGGEWRDVRVVPKGVTEFTRDTLPRNRMFRLAFTPQGFGDSPARAEVYVGGKRIAYAEAENKEQFTTMALDLSRYDTARGARVRFESQSDLYLATCEFVEAEKARYDDDAASPRPNVLIFLVDTMRPDHLGCYGFSRATSPHLDALAADGIRFTNAISQSSWTRPSVASLLTSTFPEIHGAKDRADIMRGDLATIESTLGENGYETQGFMTNATCLPMWGFGLDFSRYVDVNSYSMDPGRDAEVVNETIAALREAGGGNWFYYVHAIGPHEPYDPPAPYNTMYQSHLPGETDEAR